MAQDIRRICFNESQILSSIRDYAITRRGIVDDVLAIRGVKLEAGPGGPRVHVLTGKASAARPTVLQKDDLVRAFVTFCLKEGIGLPSRGIKTMESVAGSLAMVVRRIYPGDPDVQDWVTNSGHSSAPVAGSDDAIWQCEAIAALHDVRAVVLSVRELRPTVADHLVRLTGESEVGQFEKLEVESGADGVFARVILSQALGGATRILPPRDVLNIVVAFCRSKRIALPARSPKWLATLSEDRLSVVIAKPS